MSLHGNRPFLPQCVPCSLPPATLLALTVPRKVLAPSDPAHVSWDSELLPSVFCVENGVIFLSVGNGDAVVPLLGPSFCLSSSTSPPIVRPQPALQADGHSL
jgi:hypothetical protein